MEWEEAKPIFDEYTTADGVRKLLAMESVEEILGTMMNAAKDPKLVLKVGLALTKIKYGRFLADQGVDFDLLHTEFLKANPTAESIITAVGNDAQEFGAWVAETCPSIAPTILTLQLKPGVEAILPAGVDFSDLQQALVSLQPNQLKELEAVALSSKDAASIASAQPEEVTGDGLQETSAFLDKMSSMGSEATKAVLIARARESVKAHLAKTNMEWSDVASALETLDSETLASFATPEGAAALLIDAPQAAKVHMAVATQRRKLETCCLMLGLSWSECKPVLCTMKDTLAVFEILALKTQDQWLARLSELSVPLAVKAAAAMGKGLHDRALKRLGVAWADVRPLLASEPTVAAVQALTALSTPVLLQKLIETRTALPKRLIIAFLQPVLTPPLVALGLDFEDVRPLLEELSTDQLRTGQAEPQALVRSLSSQSKPILIALAKPELVSVLATHQLSWGDLLPALIRAPSAASLQPALDSPAEFVGGLLSTLQLTPAEGTKAAPALMLRAADQQRLAAAATKITVAELEAALTTLDPIECDKLFSSDDGLEKYVKMLGQCDSVDTDAKQLLGQLSGSTGGTVEGKVKRRLLIAKLKPSCPAELEWEDVERVLFRVPMDELKLAEQAGSVAQLLATLAKQGVGVAAKRVLIAQLRPLLSHGLRDGVTWDTVRRGLERKCEPSALRQAIRDPFGFAPTLAACSATKNGQVPKGSKESSTPSIPKPDQVKSKGETDFVSKGLLTQMKGMDKAVLALGKSTAAEMLVELPTVQRLGFRLVDRILVPSGRIGESLALMNNTMVKMVEHFKSLAATALGGLRLEVTVGKPSYFYAPTVRIVGSRTSFDGDDASAEEYEVAIISKDGVSVSAGYENVYSGLSNDFQVRFEQIGKWMLLLHDCLVAKGDMQVAMPVPATSRTATPPHNAPSWTDRTAI